MLGATNLVAAEIAGLSWLAPSPKFWRTVIGEDGVPVALPTFHPRFFSLHKMWLSGRVDREPIKRARDRAQTIAVAAICDKRLALDFNEPGLNLSAPLREQIAPISQELATNGSSISAQI